MNKLVQSMSESQTFGPDISTWSGSDVFGDTKVK